MIREILKIYTDNGLSDNPTFHDIEISEYTYTPSRMGMPTLTATLMWDKCLNDEWTGREYVELRGERFYIRHTPSSEKNNTDARYKHSIEFRSEFDEILSNVYFEDYVPSGYVLGNLLTHDKPCSNSSVFTFYGTIQEFSDRLNCAFLKAGVGDSILKTKTNLTTLDTPVGDGYCSLIDPYGDYDPDKSYEFSFENQFLWEAITSAYTTSEIQFKREGRKIIWGAEAKVLSKTFKYGYDNELLSVKQNNVNAKVVNRITMLGSSENIPHYYPNETEYGHIEVKATSGNKILTDSMLEVASRSQMLAYLNPETKAILGKYEPENKEETQEDAPLHVYNLYGASDNNYDNDSMWRPLQLGTSFTLGSFKDGQHYLLLQFSFRVEKPEFYVLSDIMGSVWKQNDPEPSNTKTPITGIKPYEMGVMSNDFSFHSKREITEEDSLLKLGFLSEGVYGVRVGIPLPEWTDTNSFFANYYVVLNKIIVKRESYVENSNKTGYYWQVGEKKYDGENSLGIKIKGGVTDAMIGDSFQWTATGRMPFQESLVPPKYRNTLGAERFYNALNSPYSEDYANAHEDAYIDPDTQQPYEFVNPFIEGAPSEYIYKNEDIKPTIEGVRNAEGLLMGLIADIDFDDDDNDSLAPENTEDDKNDSLKYEHSYFYIRLNKFDGTYGFNLFEHATQTDPMTIQMTSGACNGCKFKVQVVEVDEKGLKLWKNPVQVNSQGGMMPGSYNSGKTSQTDFIDSQQDTTTNSIWLCVQKDAETFGVLMPNQEHKYFPKIGDTFNIINIDLPDAYILDAEKRLEEEGMRYMSDNNEEKFTFDINASRIFFAEHPEILAELDEYSKIRVEYDGKTYELFVSSLTINCKNNEALPEIKIDLTDTIAVGQSFQQRIEERAQSLIANATNLGGGTGGSGGLSTALADRRYLNKQKADRTPHKLSTDTAFEVGEFVSGASGGIFYRDPETGQTYIEADKIRIRMKAIFEELEIAKTTSISGEQMITPGGGIDISFVEELDDVYRCYFKAKEENEGAKCTFVAGDQVKCQDFNIQAGTTQNASNKYYWRLVVAVNNDESYVDISKTDCDKGSDVPEAGDTIVQLGNRNDKTRQSAIVHSTVDAFAPCVTLFDGINSYSLENKEVIQYGVDKTKNPPQPFFHCYGSFYYGPKNKSSYLEFDPSLGYLVYKGILLLQSQVQDDKGNTQALQDYFESLIPDIDKDDIADIVNEIVDPQLAEMQKQLDGVIETWFGEGEPSLDRNGYPMNQWGNSSFESHAGDLYYDNETGYAYRFSKEGDKWTWVTITDEAITKALAAAAEAKKTAEGAEKIAQSKNRIFVDTPFTPYEEGDLWVNATYPKGATKDKATYYDDILKCKTTRLTGNFNISDWGYASSYPEEIAGYAYLKEATNQGTLVNGGLVLTSLIQLGLKPDTSSNWQCWSGINGIPLADAKKGYGIAAWYGGDMLDGELEKWVNPTQNRYAQSLFRFDGSGYLAGGNVSWDVNGQLTLGAGIKLGGTTLGDLQDDLETWTNYMNEFSKIFVPVDINGKILTKTDGTPNWTHDDFIAVKVVKGFYSDEFVSALGLNSEGGGSGLGASYLYNLLDVNPDTVMNPKEGQSLVYRKGKWTAEALSPGLDKTELESYLSGKNYATQSWVESKGYLTSGALTNYVTLNTAQTLTGKKTFYGGLAITGGCTENTAMPYFLGIDAFAEGGSVHFLTASKVCAAIGAATTAQLGNYVLKSGDTMTGTLTFASGLDRKIILNNTDNDTNHNVINFQQNGVSYGNLGVITVGSTKLRWDGLQGFSAPILESTVDNGTAPLVVRSSTLVSSLNADLLDGVHARGLMPYHSYSFANGCLVKLDATDVASTMVTVRIIGNSYNGGIIPIDTTIQFYNYNNSSIISYAGIHNGFNFGDIKVFCYDGFVYLWFKQPSAFETFLVTAYGYGGTNIVTSISNAEMPTNGVTRLVTITPKVSALLTDNVASATRLQTNEIFTAWGQTYFQNGVPKSVSGDMTNVGSITMSGGLKMTIAANNQTLLDLCNYGANPYGLIVSSIVTGALLIQSKRRGSTTEQFPLCLNPEGGNVAIGLQYSSYKLHVNGTFYASGAATLASTLNVTGTATIGSSTTGKLIIGGATFEWDNTHKCLKINTGFYSDSFISALGMNNSGGNGGGLFGLVTNWSNATTTDTENALGVNLGKDLYDRLGTAQTNISSLLTRVGSLEGGSALSVSTTGSGNAVTAVTKSGTTITVTKGATFATSAELGNYVTLNTAQTITGAKTFNNATWIIAANESNIITSQHWSNGTWGTSNTSYAIKNSLRFNWYNSAWFIGNIRGYGAESIGFGIGTLSSDGSYVMPNFRVATDNSYINNNAILHAGNYTSYVNPANFVTALGTNGNYLTWTKNGAVNNITVPYATSAGNADTVDGLHASSFMQYLYIRADQQSIYDLRWNFGSFDKNDYLTGAYASEYPSPYGMYISLTTRDRNAAALIFIDSGLGNDGHVHINTRKAGDSNTLFNGWKKVAYIDDNVASATQLQNTRYLWGQAFNGTGNVDGAINLHCKPLTGTTSMYNEGIRMHPHSDGWSSIVFCGTDNTGDSGTSANTWGLFAYQGNFYINKNGSSTTTTSVLCNVGENWGIGNIVPSYKLHINGTLYASGATTLGSSLTVSGATSLSSTLSVSGNTTLASDVSIGTTTIKTGYMFLRKPIHMGYSSLYFDATNAGTGIGLYFAPQSDGSITIASHNNHTYVASPFKLLYDGTFYAKNAVQIGDATISWDAAHSCLKVDKGFYSQEFISALGLNSSAGSAGSVMDLTSVSSNIIPSATGYSLGSADYPWSFLYCPIIISNGSLIFRTNKSYAALILDSGFVSLLGGPMNPSSWQFSLGGSAYITKDLFMFGNYGLGTTSPNYKLHVVGDAYISSDVSFGANLSVTDLITSQKGVMVYGSGASSANCYNFSVKDSNNSNKGYGYIGLMQQLNGGGWGMFLKSMSMDGQAAPLFLNPNGGSVHIGTNVIDQTYKLQVNGKIYASSTIYSNGVALGSDKRLKKDILPFHLSLAQIANAPSVRFKWKRDNRDDFGSIAQYWQKINPLFVLEDGDKYLTLDYGKIALASVISVANEVMSDKERIRELENRVEELERQLNG